MSDNRVFGTTDGVPITPGLRVFTNDWCWGTVMPEQFTSGRSTAVYGDYFDGWFQVALDNGNVRAYNGDRLSTREPTFADPPHLASTAAPCAWCGARWVRYDHTDGRYYGSLIMDHKPDCAYLNQPDTDEGNLP